MAFQAYYEHMPLRASQLPNGPDMQLFRRIQFGDLALLHMLDTRQYRDDQVCTGGGTTIGCAQALDPNRTLLGAAQERWLKTNLAVSPTTWNVLGQQVFFAQRDFEAGAREAAEHGRVGRLRADSRSAAEHGGRGQRRQPRRADRRRARELRLRAESELRRPVVRDDRLGVRDDVDHVGRQRRRSAGERRDAVRRESAHQVRQYAARLRHRAN